MNVDPLDISKIGDYTPTRVTALRQQVDLLNRQLERMLENRLVQERMKQELSLASQVQGFLIPDRLPNTSRLSMSAIYVPHHDVGGDYYDVVEMSPGKWLFCVADVAGKGVSAALLMAHLQASIRALARAYTDLSSLVVNVNELLGYATRSERFVTLFMGTLDEQMGDVEYICAGHIPAIRFRQGRYEYTSIRARPFWGCFSHCRSFSWVDVFWRLMMCCWFVRMGWWKLKVIEKSPLGWIDSWGAWKKLRT